jgi:hypothetical protein
VSTELWTFQPLHPFAVRPTTTRPPWRSGWRHLVVGQSHRPAIVARNDRAFPGKLSQDLVRVLHAGPGHPGAGPSSTVNPPSISLAIAVIPPRTGRMIFARATAVPNSAYSWREEPLKVDMA